MKRKLFAISLFALGALAISSCGKGSKDNSESKVEKGKTVNSVTLNVKDSYGQSNEVTISKDDSYKDMIQKLGHNTFLIIGDGDNYHPFYEKHDSKYNEEQINVYSRKVIKNDNGEYEELADYTSGNIKTKSTTKINSTVYQYDNEGHSVFYLGNYTDTDNDEYDLASGKVTFNDKEEYLNKGAYLNYSGSMQNGGSIKFATNREDYSNGLRIDDSVPENVSKDYNSLYFEAQWEDYASFSSSITRYTAKDYEMSFNLSNIMFNIYSQTAGHYYDSTSHVCNPLSMSLGDLNSIPEAFHQFYDFSFELTDKFIIIKNKVNTSEQMLNYFIESGDYQSVDEILEALSDYEGSYTYKEVWVDYKNYQQLYDNSANNLRMGYAYSKLDSVEKVESSGTWSANGRYSIDTETLQDLGLIGKKWTYKINSESHYETYIIDVDDETINNKKTEFVNKCKKNNFLEKYEFQKSAYMK